MKNKIKKVALVGNPNSGKSSLFNVLTGLRQKTGNYPGVTVEKKAGKMTLPNGEAVSLVDLPGLYSLYPNSGDEKVVVEVLLNEQHPEHPDFIIYVADITQLDKQLLLISQINDLGIPVLLVLTFSDIAQKEGIQLDKRQLMNAFGVTVLSVSSRTNENIEALKESITGEPSSLLRNPAKSRMFVPLDAEEEKISKKIRGISNGLNEYKALLLAHHYEWLSMPEGIESEQVAAIVKESGFRSIKSQIRETMARYDKIMPIVKKALIKSRKGITFTDRLDNLVTHRWFGPIIFFVLMLFVFQSIFSWASIPMDWIDSLFTFLNEKLIDVLPAGMFRDFLTDGLLPGLGGILIFIPQIALLFFLIGLLENVGYLARAVYISDKVMQKFGLNGRSIVSLISGGACAIPAVMATRTISNWKERLITIMVTPFISCSARIPVFVMIIGLVIPSTSIFGIFNLQGLVFLGLYLGGIIAALGSALAFKYILKNEEQSFLMMELPTYRSPNLKDIILSVGEKVRIFVVEAGKIILIISIALWFLASFGPGDKMKAAEEIVQTEIAKGNILAETAESELSAKKLEASYAGHIGKAIEPLIEPLGFDWKIGIALVTSFAAREVFVGTIATLYSLGNEGDIVKIQDRLAREKRQGTDIPVFNLATGVSLLVFYLLAMQCMSTLAVVKRETGGWKWPIIQFTFMSVLAYLSSFAAYQLLN